MATVKSAGIPRTWLQAGATDTGYWLYLLFFFSGISGLMYEVVWVRMLTRILGSTVYATSTVLAAFMAGLALGSYAVGRFIDRSRAPLAWYAALELGIGLSALLSLGLADGLLPFYQAIYRVLGDSRAWLSLAQGAVALTLLLIPTALMGATLPTLCAFGSRQQRDFGQCVATLYASNTLGAVTGVMASGFVLIGTVGETNTIVIGCVLNGVVAGVAVLLGAASSGAEPTCQAGTEEALCPVRDQGRLHRNGEPEAFSVYPARVRRVVLWCFAASGFAALANEVIWSRMLMLQLGTSTYAFSAMLAAVLLGMALGSSRGGRSIDRWSDPLRSLARLQLGIGLAGAASLWLYCLPWGSRTAASLLAPLVLLGPLGFLWGLAFPAAVRCFTSGRGRAGRAVGELYAWNTFGCIGGALAAGLVLIPILGAGRAGGLVALLSLLLGLVLLGVHPQGIWRKPRLLDGAVFGVAAALLALVGDPYFRVIHGRLTLHYNGQAELYRHSEQAAGTTTSFGARGGSAQQKTLWVNGQSMTAKSNSTKLMAHVPLWLAEKPRDMLVVCFGMGTTFRSACRHEGIDVQAVELVPGVLECFADFHADGPALLGQANHRVTVDDGRNYLLMHDRLYDVITVDMAPPIDSAGTVNLYSREFFALCRQRLRPGGVICFWVPNAPASEVKMIMRTFLDVFPEGGIWSGGVEENNPEAAEPVFWYLGFLLVGSPSPLSREEMAARIRRGYHQQAAVADLLEWTPDYANPDKVLDLFLADAEQMRAMLADAPIISDDHPWTEFPLGRMLLGRDDYFQALDPVELRAQISAGKHR